MLLTGDPQIFTVFSLISNLKVLKVKTAILGLPSHSSYHIGKKSKYGSLVLVLLVLKNRASAANLKMLLRASVARVARV